MMSVDASGNEGEPAADGKAGRRHQLRAAANRGGSMQGEAHYHRNIGGKGGRQESGLVGAGRRGAKVLSRVA